VKDAGKVKPKDAEAAMTEIVTMVRELETSGELLLIAGEEDED
ncbi:FliG C-terminal domain-containing protein, partial [Pseudooceanicola nitratireducens]